MLGDLVERRRQFKLQVPKRGIHRPFYVWENEDIEVNTLVGFLSIMNGKTLLSLSRIDTLWLDGDAVIRVRTTPILHLGDERKVSELLVPTFDLPVGAIACLFRKVKE